MSDDIWRDRRDDDDYGEFGSLFDDDPDDAEPTRTVPETGRRADRPPLRFGDDASGPMPHWTSPPTGEVPQLAGDVPDDDDGEFDVWSSFSSDAPVWQDDPAPADDGPHGGFASGRQRRVTEDGPLPTGEFDAVPDSASPPPNRITIGTDPSGMVRRSPQTGTGRRPGSGPSTQGAASAPAGGRDMPTAIAVGLLIAAAFIGSLMWRPWSAAVLVTVVLGLAAVEFYNKVAEKGYRPAVVPGVLTCVAAPAAAYWLGIGTLPLVIPFGFMAAAASFIGARSVDAGPMPNISITTLGVMWVGFLGTFAVLILRLSTQVVSEFPSEQALAANRGTDTVFLLAVGVVANDVGALVFGSAVGRTPLRSWISPNKTVEGFVGGAFATIIALMFVGLSGRSTTWSSNWDLLVLALVIAVMAPIGDLVESMFKRNLDVKDFGTLVRGHGGVLDRFDGFLFVLPAVYYLTVVIEPWTEYTAT